MELILIRHAKAEEQDVKKFPDDSLRPLSEQGKKEQRQISKVMRRMDITFDYLLTSPMTRAKQTAEIVADVFGWNKKIEEVDALGKKFSVAGVIAHLKRYDKNSMVACVGHEPDFSELSAFLLHESGNVGIDFKKSGAMCIGFEGHPEIGSGTLTYFLKPGMIKNL